MRSVYGLLAAATLGCLVALAVPVGAQGVRSTHGPITTSRLTLREANMPICFDGPTCARALAWNSSQNVFDFSGQIRTNGNFILSTSGGVKWSASAGLVTCTSSYEGYVYRQGGGATGSRTRLCLCSSDGSSNYAWQNMATGAVGTTTTCP